jgi:hypothetical protein
MAMAPIIPTRDWRVKITESKKWSYQVQPNSHLPIRQWIPQGYIHNIPHNKTEVCEWTPQFYNLFLVDPNWSQPETLLLFDLCRKYTCNFFIVHDGWTGTQRSIPELKNRYYHVTRIVMQQEGKSRAEIDLYDYDLNKEIVRLEYIDILNSRY